MPDDRSCVCRDCFSYCLAEYMFSGVYLDVEVKRYLDPSDTGLLRALHSRNPVI